MYQQEIINERTTSYLTVTALDADGNPAQPASATYSVMDKESKKDIKENLPLTFVDGVVIITLDIYDAQILDPNNKREYRRVSIDIIYGDDDELHDEYLFTVANLHNIGSPQ